MIPVTFSTLPPPSRKVFNTFIDDGALMNGVKRSSRDGIKRMIKDGAINLFVPLHTLDRLRRLAKGRDRLSRDATEALRWLDEITSTSDRVHLQGGFELYSKWDDVEQYMLPDTLLSMETESLAADSIPDDFADLQIDSINPDLSDKVSLSSSESLERHSIKSSPISTYSAPSPQQKEKVLAPIGTGRPCHKKTPSEASAASNQSAMKNNDDRIPYSLRPFFNHIIWRIHHEQNADVAMESFILITHDGLKQTIAKRFGIRAKTLEQLRKIIARETKDYKSRLASTQKVPAVFRPVEPVLLERKDADLTEGTAVLENGAADETASDRAVNSGEEDEVVFKREPPKTPQVASPDRKVFDPNHFGRSTPVPNGSAHRGNSPAHPPNTTPRGGRGGRAYGNFRGRGGPRGGFSPVASPKSAPRPPPVIDLNTPIDPDSFARPGQNGRARGRGVQRRLWEPS